MSLDTAIWMTGRSEKLKVKTWVFAASGSFDRRLMASWTFCSAVAIFVPYVNDAVTCDTFALDVERLDSRPATPWIAASIGTDTSLSTTAGEAPG